MKTTIMVVFAALLYASFAIVFCKSLEKLVCTIPTMQLEVYQ